MLPAAKQWQLSENATQVSDETIASLAMSLNQPAFLVRLAFARGYTTEAAIQAYLATSTTFHDPFRLHDMQKLVDRLLAAVAAQEKILIYGDYDADGITSTTILMETLENLGADVTYYLPDRFEDGYGPNQAVYQYYIRQGIQVILTCDNGVSGQEAIAYAMSQGVDVLITDHHELPKVLPDAYAIVHPRHPEGDYPFGDLCGAGVALKVATALTGALPEELLDLAAIGTVADVVSLTDENRFIVQAGIEQIKRGERLGLALLLEKEGIDSHSVDEETIGFQIAPRLNSLGRIKQAAPGVELMMTFDPEIAEAIVTEVVATNQERKQLAEQMTQSVFDQLAALDQLPDCIILADEQWHEGILGIVASRVVEATHRPTILLRHDVSAQHYKGSGRSIAGVNLFTVLASAGDFALNWGGHAMAAGMTIAEDQFGEWQEQVQTAMTAFHEQVSAKAVLTYDMTLPLDQLTLAHAEALSALKPFGADNPKPQFRLEQVPLKQVQSIGKDQRTLKVTTQNQAGEFPLIGFQLGEKARQLAGETQADFIVTLSINEWQGQRQAQGFIVDMKSEAPALFDWRQAKNRQDIFNVNDAIYAFESAHYLEAYQASIPASSLGLVMADWEESRDLTAYSQLVIFDCIHDRARLKQLIQQAEIKNIYLFAYSHQHAYMIGQPLRQEFARLYQYLRQHPGIHLAGNEAAVARYLHLAAEKMPLMLKAFQEGQLIRFDEAGQLLLLSPQTTVDLGSLPSMKAWQAQMQSERFFLYSSLEQIKDFFFPPREDH